MSNLDPHFVGAKQKRVKLDNTVETTFGFFDHINGSTKTIRNKLITNLNMAQDTQAIFEFVQNAVDADATDFFMYYDDTQFLALNNGDAFSYDDIYSIIRVGASNKVETASDEEFIGRFGVGFKLIHRMVGAQNGVDEMININAGPVMFSWGNKSQLNQLRNVSDVTDLELGNNDLNDSSPWLFKFLLTCFPTLPQTIDNNVRDLHHREISEIEKPLFDEQELQSLISFLNEFWDARGDDLNKIDLSEGSLFYLKLGTGKKEKLDDDIDSYKSGLNYSLKFTETIGKRRGLKNIYFNNHDVISSEQVNLEVDDPIHINSDDPEYDGLSELLEEKDQGIKITFRFAYEGYPDNSQIELGSLKDEPNFFKYFPMGKEDHKLNFILHCNVFSIESSRREFQQDDDLNKDLLKVFCNRFKKRLDTYKETKKEKFRNIFLSVLFSDDPIKKHKDAKWISDLLFNPLHKYFLRTVPMFGGGYEEIDNVVIKGTSLPVDSSLIEGEKQWFRYMRDSDVNSQICERAEGVMDIPSWDLVTIIENMSSESFSNWYTSLNAEQQGQLKDELSDQLSGELKVQFWKNIQLVDGIYELVKECGVDQPKKKFVLSFDRIVLKKETITAQNKNLFALLEVAKEFEGNEQFLDEFQDSCRVISDSGDKYKLKDVAQKDSVTFTIDKEDYNLPLSEILPDKYQETSGVFQPILDAFNELELDFSTLLGIKGERNKNNLAEHIESAFDSYTTTQFVFFMLYSMEKETQKFKKKPDTPNALEALDYFFKKEYPYPVDYEKYFDGLQASRSIYPNKLATNEEKLPDSISHWIERDCSTSDSKLEYLKEAGLKSKNHSHLKLRKRLIDDFADITDKEYLSDFKKKDYVSLFHFLIEQQVELTGPAKGIFNILTKKANGEELQSNLVPLPVIIGNEQGTDTKIKLLSAFDDKIKTGKGYIVTSELQDGFSKNFTYTLNDLIKTFETSPDFLIEGRFIDQSYLDGKEELNPRHANDLSLGKELALNIKPRFIEEWENKLRGNDGEHYTIHLFEGPVPRSIEFKNHLIKQYEGNKFYVDDANKTVFVGYVKNTEEVDLFNLIQNYLSSYSGGKNEYKLIQILKSVAPEKLQKGKSNSKYYQSKVKQAEKFTGDWLRNVIQWEKAKKEEVYYRNNKLRFNKVSIDADGKMILSEYEYDIIPSFIEAYEEFEKIILYSDINSVPITLEAIFIDADDFKIHTRIKDKNKIEEALSFNDDQNEVKALVKLGDEDPWLKELHSKLFQGNLIDDEDQLDVRITSRWASPDLSFIFGPPGTGKTTKSVLYALHDLAQCLTADCKARILVLAPTNKAADVFIEKAFEFFARPDSILDLNIGLSGDEQSQLYEFLKGEDVSSYLYRFGNSYSEKIPMHLIGKSLPVTKQSLVATTIHRYVHNNPINEYNTIDSEGVSKVVLDEASMISLSHILYALLTVSTGGQYLINSKLKPITISGDPFQLKPVGLTPNPLESQGYSGWSTESIYTLLNLETFDLDQTPVGSYTIDNLKTQYRSSAIIGELYSTYCYKGLLNHFHQTLNSDLDSVFPDSIYEVQFQVHDHDSDQYPLTKLYTYRKYSTYHLYSCILAIELAAKIKNLSDENILLLTPYGIQARIMKDIIEEDQHRFTDGQVSAGTIHSSQGDEADHVILVQNPSRTTNSHLAFYNNKHIINVAISRVKKKLFALLPDPYMMAKNSSNELYERVLTDEHPVQSLRYNEFENDVWGDDNFIKDKIRIRNYSDFVIEDITEIKSSEKKYQFYAGEGKVFSWFNPGINESFAESVELNSNRNK